MDEMRTAQEWEELIGEECIVDLKPIYDYYCDAGFVNINAILAYSIVIVPTESYGLELQAITDSRLLAEDEATAEIIDVLPAEEIVVIRFHEGDEEEVSLAFDEAEMMLVYED